MVLLSEASAMALTSQGECKSFLSAALPGVPMVAHCNTVVSGVWACASAGDVAKLVISKATEAMMQPNIRPNFRGHYRYGRDLVSSKIKMIDKK